MYAQFIKRRKQTNAFFPKKITGINTYLTQKFYTIYYLAFLTRSLNHPGKD